MSSTHMRAAERSLGCYLLMFGLLVVSTTRLVVQVHGGDVVSTQTLVTPDAALTYSESCSPDSFITSWSVWPLNWDSGAAPNVGHIRVQCSNGQDLPGLGQPPTGVAEKEGVTATGVTAIVVGAIPYTWINPGATGDTRLLQGVAVLDQAGPSGQSINGTAAADVGQQAGVMLCPSGQVLVGLTGATLGTGITAIGLICGRRPAARSVFRDKWNFIGKMDGVELDLPGRFNFNQSCPPGSFIHQFKTQKDELDGKGVLTSIQAECSDGSVLGPSPKPYQEVIESEKFPTGIAGLISACNAWSSDGGVPLMTQVSYIMRPPVDATVSATGPTGNFTYLLCGISGQVAIGIFGYVGVYVEKLGIICGTVPTLPIAPLPNETTSSPVPTSPNQTSTPPTPSPIPSPNPPTTPPPGPPPSPPSGLTQAQKIGAIVAPIATVVGVAFTVAYTSWKWYHKRKAKAQESSRSSGSLPSVTADTEFK